ncbi:MAG TPA: hypothetical protein VK388_12130 [Pyrinomonadaceae bacterium]|nr:hypothetical protein [Pyrinomonadaceae bacterium]
MAKLLASKRKSILVVCCFVFLLSTVALALSVRTRSQLTKDTARKEKSESLKQIEVSPEHSLRVLGNDDCPLRIVEAKAKEVSGALFTKLTGKTTNLKVVPSVPEVRLVNTSGQTIKKFFLFVRSPEDQFTRGVGRKVEIKPGESYTVERVHFAAPEKIATAVGNAQLRETLAAPGMDSEKMWLSKGVRSNLYVTVVKVEFEDGSSWTLQEGGDVR